MFSLFLEIVYKFALTRKHQLQGHRIPLKLWCRTILANLIILLHKLREDPVFVENYAEIFATTDVHEELYQYMFLRPIVYIREVIFIEVGARHSRGHSCRILVISPEMRITLN